MSSAVHAATLSVRPSVTSRFLIEMAERIDVILGTEATLDLFYTVL